MVNDVRSNPVFVLVTATGDYRRTLGRIVNLHRRLTTYVGISVIAAAALSLGIAGVSNASSTPSATHPSSTHTFLSTLGHIAAVGSTVPANGDINPYGVAVVRASVGRLIKGDTLVSNFNYAANVQGTGRTLVELSPQGKRTLFAKVTKLPKGQHCPGGIGLSTALTILPGGWVVVGSIPAAGPSGAPTNSNPAGCLIVLNKAGAVAEAWSNAEINGPWDLVSSVKGSSASIFVSNALSRPPGNKPLPSTGLCTVARINVTLGAGAPRLTSSTVVGRGFPWKVNHATFVLAPTGLALSSSGTLYVVQTLGNHITVIPNALNRSTSIVDGKSTLTKGGALNSPLGLVMAPNGDLIVTNGNNGVAVEISPQGHQVATATLVHNGAGALFGITISLNNKGLVFVNDSTNAVDTDIPRA